MGISPRGQFRARVVDIDVGARRVARIDVGGSRVVDLDVFQNFRGCEVRLDVCKNWLFKQAIYCGIQARVK